MRLFRGTANSLTFSSSSSFFFAFPFSYGFCAAICFINLPVLSGCFISLLTLDLRYYMAG